MPHKKLGSVDKLKAKKAAAAKRKATENKARANKRKMLVSELKGLKEEGKHWEDVIKKTGRKEKATKVIEGVATAAGFLTGVGGLAKAGAKAAGKKATSLAAKRMNKVSQKSKNAARKPRVGEATTKTKAAGKNLPVKRKMMGKSNQNPPKLGSNKKKTNLPVKRKK